MNDILGKYCYLSRHPKLTNSVTCTLHFSIDLDLIHLALLSRELCCTRWVCFWLTTDDSFPSHQRCRTGRGMRRRTCRPSSHPMTKPHCHAGTLGWRLQPALSSQASTGLFLTLVFNKKIRKKKSKRHTNKVSLISERKQLNLADGTISKLSSLPRLPSSLSGLT